jgi:maleylacetoacetate isomerase
MAETNALTLYGYFRSSAAYRVRIALNLKNLKPDHRFIHLLKDGGQQHEDAYKAINPQELVPTLIDNGHVIAQSLAIMEYLDETYPEPPLLPKDALGRARVRQLAYAVACDIHPINNLRVLKHLRIAFGATDERRAEWQKHWIALGFMAIESLLLTSTDTGIYCHGNEPTLADICLIPQMANAHRVDLDLTPYPVLLRIEQTALAHPAFAAAQPKEQRDAE